MIVTRHINPRLVNGYCSITIANYGLIRLIRFIVSNYTHLWKCFANRLYLIYHACKIPLAKILDLVIQTGPSLAWLPLDEDRPRLAWLHRAIHPINAADMIIWRQEQTPRNPAQQSNPKVRFLLQVHARMGMALEESGWMQLAEQPTWTLTPPAPGHMLCKRFME